MGEGKRDLELSLLKGWHDPWVRPYRRRRSTEDSGREEAGRSQTKPSENPMLTGNQGNRMDG